MIYSWSCLLDSFSMALDIPAGLIEKALGHDGGEIIWPGLKEPLCRRGFHIQEFIGFCFENGYAVMEIQALPSAVPLLSDSIQPMYLYSSGTAVRRLRKFMENNKGVLVGFNNHGNRHAIAWDGKDVIDPARRITHLNDFEIESFFLIKSLS